ncbi:radiation-inducible immediate-early gene IEX-1 [Eleutherodactylus coqui]|uniref:radiation-inducible immediate-early gene IEX-1 n=1 Tax=Eleutherodactylus coqui TaxID=57060 RepID=UPI0034637DBF
MQRRRPAPLPALSLSDSDSDAEPRLTRPPARTSLPEVFTFDVESVIETAVKPLHRRGASKRPRRVLYPAKVRRYLPPPETDRPRRWLYLLCLLVFVQICCEEAAPEELPTPAALQRLQPAALLPVIPEPTAPSNGSQPLLHDLRYHER